MTQSELASATAGRVTRQQVSDYARGDRYPNASNMLDLADALGVEPRWLADGSGAPVSQRMINAADAEWLFVPRFALADFTPEAKPAPIETVPLRRDWLNRQARASSGLWLTAMPSHLLEDGPEEGDDILCQDATAPSAEGLYLWMYDGMPIVRRVRADPFTPSGFAAPDRAWMTSDPSTGPRIVARILGSIKLRAV